MSTSYCLPVCVRHTLVLCYTSVYKVTKFSWNYITNSHFSPTRFGIAIFRESMWSGMQTLRRYGKVQMCKNDASSHKLCETNRLLIGCYNCSTNQFASSLITLKLFCKMFWNGIYDKRMLPILLMGWHPAVQKFLPVTSCDHEGSYWLLLKGEITDISLTLRPHHLYRHDASGYEPVVVCVSVCHRLVLCLTGWSLWNSGMVSAQV